MMTPRFPKLATLVLLLTGCATQSRSEPSPGVARVQYPATPKGDQVDDYHGTLVHDPYRWLESIDSREVVNWTDAQAALTSGTLAALPMGSLVRRRLKALGSYARFPFYAPPRERAGRSFFLLNDDQSDHPALCVADSLGGDARPLLDPDDLAADASVSMPDFEPSPDGRLVAYALSINGSDERVWHVLSVETGESFAGTIEPARYGRVRWSVRSDGLFYLAARGDGLQQVELRVWRPAPEPTEQLIHTVDARDEDLAYFLWSSLRSPHLYLITWDGETETSQVDLLAYDADLKSVGLRRISGEDKALYQVIGDANGVVFMLTDLGAPKQRVVGVPEDGSDHTAMHEVVPEGPHQIRSANLIGEHIVVSYLQDAVPKIHIHDLTGKVTSTPELPGIGSLEGFREDTLADTTLYSFETASSPLSIYQLDARTGESRPAWLARADHEPRDFVTHQVFFESEDGTRIPMFLSHKAGLERNGRNPVLMAGYGGFGFTLTPNYGTLSSAWLELGGIYATPNLRGGGFYGEAWHQAGTKLEKQNTFDDLIAAAEWLIAEGYTCPERLALLGTSNGGLVVGASVTQRPELFGAALLDAGLLDMLRVKAINQSGWENEFGSALDPDGFAALYAYSPVHNVRQGMDYPAMLISTGDADDRVTPANSYKFAAALQEAQAGSSPILLRINKDTGHGITPLSALSELQADRLTFLIDEFGLEEEARAAFSD